MSPILDELLTVVEQTLSSLWTRMEWMSTSRLSDLNTLFHALHEGLKWDVTSSSWWWWWTAIPRNALLPLLAVALVFWPLLVSLLYAFMAASTWIIWLVTSFLLGCLQFVYVGYQFVMITGDLCGFFLLKSYSMACHIFLTNLSAINKKQHKMSRRRYWRQRLDAAGSYENFLKIRIEPKEEEPQESNKGGLECSASPTRKANAMIRSTSFDGSPSSRASSSSSSASRSTTAMSSSFTTLGRKGRSKSFGGLTSFFSSRSAQDDDHTVATTQDVSSFEEDSNNNNVDPVVSAELGERVGYLLVNTTERLLDARREIERCRQQVAGTLDRQTDGDDHGNRNNHHKDLEEAWNRLKYLLSAVMKRNHLHLDSLLVDNAQTINNTGRYGLSNKSRQVIRAFYDQVQKGLDFLADAPAFVPPPPPAQQPTPQTLDHDHPLSPTSPPPSEAASWSSSLQEQLENEELSERVRVVRKMKHNMGRTALMLSGGGAQAMYHIGVLKALIESKLYQDISVISGTSGGSITAAMCAIKTPEELFQQVCVSHVSTDFGLTGEQGKQNIRWFPTAMEMVAHFLKHKLLIDINEFRRTCKFYYGDMTFEEAFERTGKHVCISVSASRANAESALQRLLLNHISTPRVTLASAVAASCALPGVMAPTSLMTKNSQGELEPFEVDGVEWIDGSVQADIPFQRIATMFAVSNFIVSQTNFHIVPLLNKELHPDQKSLYRRLLLLVEWDIRSRALKLSRLGLFPKIFGQDMSKAFEQKYHGNLTIVPRLTTTQTFGLRTLSNPTEEDMKVYIKYGEIVTWPFLNAIRDTLRLEKVIDDCLNRLEHRLGNVHDADNDWYDDVESFTSSNRPHPLVRSMGSFHSHTNSQNPSGSASPVPPPSTNSGRVVKISCAGLTLSFPGSGGGNIRQPSQQHKNNAVSKERFLGDEDVKLRQRTKQLEVENRVLREQLQQLQKQLVLQGTVTEEKCPT